MQLNKKVEYAICIILYVYFATKNGSSVTANQIYDATDIPHKYLTVILSELQRYGILKSIRGFKGGYFISKPLTEINLMDLVKATSRPSTRHKTVSENQFQNFARSLSDEIAAEYEKILVKTDFETIYRKFENLLNPMTPMFYI